LVIRPSDGRVGSPHKEPEPRHESEIAMARFQVDTTLGDPGYGKRSVA
jgi:hypothetical protein